MAWRLERAQLQELLDVLQTRGFSIVGPRRRDHAIVYDRLTRVEELPVGWTDAQEAGVYRLQRRQDEALFGYNVGPHSWKKFLLPPEQRLWRAQRSEEGFAIEQEPLPSQKLAFLGVRSCELAAIARQDRIFMRDAFVDPYYAAQREQLFLIAVQCTQAGGTCFCTSMNTGPRAEEGFDLALTELLDESEHSFLVEAGTPAGEQLVAALSLAPASEDTVACAMAASAKAEAQMGRQLETKGLKDALANAPEHPRWEEVASRCLSCANCTMVCPTCFCTDVQDTTDLTGEHAERWRMWDSCFHMSFTTVHGGSVRASVKSRYRQWMTHKLSTWHDQFGESGCVGCGRCVTWCPAHIDLTQEAHAIQSNPQAPKPTPTK